MSFGTKRALADALQKLLQTRTLDKITVKEIVEEAGVNRQTFYYHYQDIYDLIQWIFEQRAEAVLANITDGSDLRAEFTEAIRAMQAERNLVLNAYRSISREYLEQYIFTITDRLLLPLLDNDPVEEGVSPDDRAFIASFFKYALLGILVNWIRGGMKEDPEHIVDQTVRLMEGEIHRTLLRFSKEEPQKT